MDSMAFDQGNGTLRAHSSMDIAMSDTLSNLLLTLGAMIASNFSINGVLK